MPASKTVRRTTAIQNERGSGHSSQSPFLFTQWGRCGCDSIFIESTNRTWLGNRYSSFNGASYSYDADGNVTRKIKSGVYDRQYFWSAESRLDSTFDGSSFKGYDYNALGKPSASG